MDSQIHLRLPVDPPCSMLNHPNAFFHLSVLLSSVSSRCCGSYILGRWFLHALKYSPPHYLSLDPPYQVLWIFTVCVSVTLASVLVFTLVDNVRTWAASSAILLQLSLLVGSLTLAYPPLSCLKPAGGFTCSCLSYQSPLSCL